MTLATARGRRSEALAKLGRTADAERKFREVLAFSPDDADAWRELQLIGKAY